MSDALDLQAQREEAYAQMQAHVRICWQTMHKTYSEWGPLAGDPTFGARLAAAWKEAMPPDVQPRTLN